MVNFIRAEGLIPPRKRRGMLIVLYMRLFFPDTADWAF